MSTDPYRVLLAEILLQRTPAERVAEFYPSFLKEYPTVTHLASANVKELRKLLTPLGLQKRAQWLIELATRMVKEYGGHVPDRQDELTKLPGVGSYTANAILCFGFRRDVSIVDVNVARVLRRVFGLQGRRPPSRDEALLKLASDLVPRGSGPEYNEALLDFAALVCGPEPRCGECPLSRLCNFYKERVVEVI